MANSPKTVSDVVCLSVIVPFLNSAGTLPNTLRSLSVALSIGRRRNVEVLFVDNGSSDSSRDLVEDFCENAQNARCILEATPGVSAARNAGMKAALGEYIAWVDSDDEVAPGYLASLLEVLESSPDLIVMPFSAHSEGKGVRVGTDRPGALEILTGWWCWQFVFRRALSDGLWFRGQCFEDFGFFPRLVERCQTIDFTVWRSLQIQ
jgi:glycosyltransferase involved in cell wall biosynthesis